MTGYRSGFVAADAELIDALKQFGPSVGTAPQEFVQRASIVAWGDETHVERVRDIYRRKRDVLLPALQSKGIRVAGLVATIDPCREGRGRRAGRRRVARQWRGPGGDPRVLPRAADGAAGSRAVRVPRQDSAEARLREARSAGRPARGGALRIVPVARRRDDAELREHRRV